MEPTREILNTFVTTGVLLDWIPVKGDFRAAFLKAVGVDDEEPVRSLAAIDEADIQAIRGSLKVGEDYLSPA